MTKRLLNFTLNLLVAFTLTAPAWCAPQQVDVVPMKRVATYGRKAVTTSGTEVQLASSAVAVTSCAVKALAANTNNIYIGGDSSVTTSNGFVLDAGETLVLDVDDPQDIWLDSDTNGEGVSFVCVR